MLRLLPKPGAGQDPPKQRRKWARAAALYLTPEESARVRAAMRNTARALGGYDVLAIVTGVPETSLKSAAFDKAPLGPGYALVVARAAQIPLESLLSGKMRPTDRCPTCGAHPADRRKVGAT